ncbi:MAG: peptidase M64 N-terminal domain-containing protein, partial [Planctomycetota bacterium]
MPLYTLSLMLLSFLLPGTPEEADYDTFFLDKALRVDLHHFGTADQERICIDELIEEPVYAGPKKHLIDPRKYGSHLLQVYDTKSEALLFSRGFCTLFGEWKTTD